MNLITIVERSIVVFFALCYSYQMFYLIWILVKKNRITTKSAPFHKIGIVISARNESAVIGALLDSINNQDYPCEFFHVYVVADNCTDQTAMVARSRGAAVFERFDSHKVGKGYALDFLFQKILGMHQGEEAFLILDADNILDRHYLREMNRTLSAGYRIITGYRNSKNYGSNWISAGYSLWFLRESKFLNQARMSLHTSCAVSGTGFMVTRDIVEKQNGWKYYLLTEDIQFSVDQILQGEKIGYCPSAILYDEQPVTWSQSWNQRLRWAKGFYQVLGRYGLSLVKTFFIKRDFSCFDMLMMIFPAIFLTCLSIACYLLKIGYAALVVQSDIMLMRITADIMYTLINAYISMFVIGLITLCSEWKNIYCTSERKIRYIFTFPFFMLTYIPIALAAMFQKVEWKPIRHTVLKSFEQIRDVSHS